MLSLNPFRTAVPFWGQTSQILCSLSPKRDCGNKGANGRLFSSSSLRYTYSHLPLECTWYVAYVQSMLRGISGERNSGEKWRHPDIILCCTRYTFSAARIPVCRSTYTLYISEFIYEYSCPIIHTSTWYDIICVVIYHTTAEISISLLSIVASWNTTHHQSLLCLWVFGAVVLVFWWRYHLYCMNHTIFFVRVVDVVVLALTYLTKKVCLGYTGWY